MSCEITNISTSSVAAVMVKFAVLRHDGATETRWILRHNFDDAQSNLLPSQSFVFSPLGIHPQSNAANHPEWQYITAEIDSVLLPSGHLIGNDEAAIVATRKHKGLPLDIDSLRAATATDQTSSFATRDHYFKRWQQHVRTLSSLVLIDCESRAFAEAERIGIAAATRSNLR